MKVKDVMMRTAARCRPDTNLGAAVELMWTRNCGILPVVDAQDKLIGVITDRDICIALGTRSRLPGDIAVKDVASSHVYWCKSEDDVRSTLQIMAASKVRRLPVVNASGALEGILSMDDVVLHAEAGNRASELPAEDVVKTLKAVYSPQLPQVVPKKLAAA
jgi:CBS domain-containing protein